MNTMQNNVAVLIMHCARTLLTGRSESKTLSITLLWSLLYSLEIYKKLQKPGTF